MNQAAQRDSSQETRAAGELGQQHCVCPWVGETPACSRAPDALLHPAARSLLPGCPSGWLQPVLPPKHPKPPRWPQPSQGSARQGPAPCFSREKSKVHVQRDSLRPRSQAFVRSELGASHRHSAWLRSTGGSGEAFSSAHTALQIKKQDGSGRLHPRRQIIEFRTGCSGSCQHPSPGQRLPGRDLAGG